MFQKTITINPDIIYQNNNHIDRISDIINNVRVEINNTNWANNIESCQSMESDLKNSLRDIFARQEKCLVGLLKLCEMLHRQSTEKEIR